MHDSQLEERLRTVLRDEGDRLPFHVDVERLEGQLAVRRRARRTDRFGLLAAAIGIVAFALVAAGLNGWFGTDRVGGVDEPTASAPAVLPEIAAPDGTIAFDVGSERVVPLERAGGAVSKVVGRFPAAPLHSLSIVCLGPGLLEYSIGSEAGGDLLASSSVPCDGVPVNAGVSMPDATGDRDVYISVDSSAAWHVIGGTQGELSGAVLPILRVSPWRGQRDGVAARDACGRYVDEAAAAAALADCVRTPWPGMGGQPALAVERGEDLAFQVDGWTIAKAEILATPLDAVARDIEPAPQIQLYDGEPDREMVLVPATLEAGSWVVRINVFARGDPDHFVASMFVRIDVTGA